MKRLVCLLIGAFNLATSAQPYSVRNSNQDYLVSSLSNYDVSRKGQIKIARDNNGMYWFHSLIEIFSFDGVNWKSYQLKTVKGTKTPFRINDIEISDDGNIWLATETGIYGFDRESEIFKPIKELLPGIKGIPLAVSCFHKGIAGNLLFISATEEGFYLLEWKTKKLQQIIIDSINHEIVLGGDMVGITVDKDGNVWGLTKEKHGIWNYDFKTRKVKCSWKGELPEFGDRRFQNVIGITYSANEDALWLSYGNKGWLEKKFLQTGKSNFYSFSGDLTVNADTSIKGKLQILYVKTDRNNDQWLKVGKKYLVKLNRDIARMEYIVNDASMPIEDVLWFETEKKISNPRIKENDILLWVQGSDKMSMIKKRGDVIRHVPFDTLSESDIQPKDYDNTSGRQTIFFEKGKDGNYFLLQQNDKRPKLICIGKNFQIKKALFNDEWKQYPAFFSQSFDPDTFYIAIMRPGTEPLDFRNVVLKDFKVDLNSFKVEEVKLDFKHRVWRYGTSDADNVYWLFSNGTLYSYDPKINILDSITICKPASKGYYPEELIKGSDYPTVLHKNSATFWIDFIPKRELYKINLKTKKIDRIFKCCFDRADCDIAGGVFDMYNFDTTRIYLQQSFSALLINVKNDSLTDYFDLFRNKPGIQNPSGSGLYKDWACFIFPSQIYFYNTLTGSRKDFVINGDFKWPISQFNSRPLMNDKGEMILMSSNKGFLVFNIDSLTDSEKPGAVHLSFIKLDNRNLPLDSMLKNKIFLLKYNKFNSIQIGFSDYSVFDPGKISYEYTLYKGGDTIWNKIEGKPELTFSEIIPGKYQLLLRAGNGFGDYSEKITAFPLEIIPRFGQTIWFKLIVLAAIGFIFFGLYLYRLGQIKKVQIIRNNIATDLHDDIGSTLNSISIYSEVAKQQAGKEIPALDMIGVNSRKIIESMSDIVWTINPENDSFEKIIVRMRSFAHQLLKAKKVEYTFDADEKLNSIALPMQVRKNFYLVFKEAVTNLIKYSDATRVSILLTEKDKVILLQIRDNGKGIPVNAETQGNGLMNMKRRAEEIHAILNIKSADGEGTGIELMLKI
ncbi:MAG TPA: ATP-binding protein [Chitinophagaceae bacterium]|nr:ATP-binding protein [Chitinophagaceae bacterium]